MAAAAGLPEPEMAAAVLAQEPSSPPGPARPDAPRRPGPAPAPSHGPRGPADSAPASPGRSPWRPGEWIEAGRVLGPADDPVAIAAAERAKDGAELVGALAEQLRSRFGVAAVAVWLLDADGALDLFGQDGLGGTESSRWRRLPPQFDCLEQRVVADGRGAVVAGRDPRRRRGARRRAVGARRGPRGTRAAGPHGDRCSA